VRHALVLVALATAAAASAHAEALPKKDLLRQGKSTTHGPVPAPGTRPRELVNLYNEHTHDWLAVDPKAPPSEEVIDEFLRDHYTNMPTKMDPKLVGVVVSAAKKFKRDVVSVVSGFRHPKFNLMLRKKGHQVARDSQHTHGNAIDFMLPDITVDQLHAWAKAQKLGGVGLYEKSGFVHMDTGAIRYWSGD
jgi:uncharacterized protein YcbK (DUF882 family)